jgi:hypothetical protein
MIQHLQKQVNTFLEQNVSNKYARPIPAGAGLSGTGQRPTQQPAAHRPFENKGLVHGILSGKVAS